jgi:hypothetical protein
MELRKKLKEFEEWLDKGDGGYSWYEPYLTNRELVWIGIGTAIVCGIIITGCWLLSKFYYLSS